MVNIVYGVFRTIGRFCNVTEAWRVSVSGPIGEAVRIQCSRQVRLCNFIVSGSGGNLSCFRSRAPVLEERACCQSAISTAQYEVSSVSSAWKRTSTRSISFQSSVTCALPRGRRSLVGCLVRTQGRPGMASKVSGQNLERADQPGTAILEIGPKGDSPPRPSDAPRRASSLPHS